MKKITKDSYKKKYEDSYFDTLLSGSKFDPVGCINEEKGRVIVIKRDDGSIVRNYHDLESVTDGNYDIEEVYVENIIMDTEKDICVDHSYDLVKENYKESNIYKAKQEWDRLEDNINEGLKKFKLNYATFLILWVITVNKDKNIGTNFLNQELGIERRRLIDLTKILKERGYIFGRRCSISNRHIFCSTPDGENVFSKAYYVWNMIE